MELLSADEAPWTRSRRYAAFRSDLGRKRALLDGQLLDDDGDELLEMGRRTAAFRSDLGKRLVAFRSDLGKRPSHALRFDEPSKKASSAFRSDLGKRMAAFRSDLGKRA